MRDKLRANTEATHSTSTQYLRTGEVHASVSIIRHLLAMSGPCLSIPSNPASTLRVNTAKAAAHGHCWLRSRHGTGCPGDCLSKKGLGHCRLGTVSASGKQAMAVSCSTSFSRPRCSRAQLNANGGAC